MTNIEQLEAENEWLKSELLQVKRDLVLAIVIVMARDFADDEKIFALYRAAFYETLNLDDAEIEKRYREIKGEVDKFKAKKY